MLPDIRSVIATILAATGLMILAFAAAAAFRVAQETRVAALQMDLAQRGHAVAPAPRPIVVLETPGPTLLAKASLSAPAAEEETPASAEASSPQEESMLPVAAAIAENSPTAEVAPERDLDSRSLVTAAAPILDTSVGAPRILAMGGPSPQEIAHAKAQRRSAERARARKASAERKRKARAARVARERAAARRAAAAQKQQARAASPPSGFDFNPAGAFNTAPFGNAQNFDGAANRSETQRPAVR